MLKYTETALQNECEAIRTAAAGTKHNTRFKAAAAVGELVAADWAGLTHEVALAALMAAAMSNTTQTAEQIEATLRDGLARGMLQPRARPAELTPAAGKRQQRQRRPAAALIVPTDNSAWTERPAAGAPMPPTLPPAPAGAGERSAEHVPTGAPLPDVGALVPTRFGGRALVTKVDPATGCVVTSTGLAWGWDGRRLVMPAEAK